jgi:hypothetical protein
MFNTQKDSFTLNEKKIWLVQAMHNIVNLQHECCPFLGECVEEFHTCNLSEYAGQCYYRTLKIEVKPVEKTPSSAIKEKKNTIQKCKR